MAPQKRTSIQRLYGSERYNPITVTAAVPGYQLMNQLSAGGPPGQMPKHLKFAPLQAGRFEFAVPAEREAQLQAAAQLLDTAHFDGWLLSSRAAAAASAFAPPDGTAPGVVAQIGSAFTTAATAAAQAVGLKSRPTPLLANMAAADVQSGARATSPVLLARVQRQQTTIAAAGAQYAAQGIRIALDKAVLCLQAAAGDQGERLGGYVAEFKLLSDALHQLPAQAPAERRVTHAQALQDHQAAMPALPDDVKPALAQVFAKLGSVAAEQARVLLQHKDALAAVATAEALSMAAVIEQAGAADPSFGQTLRTLIDRLNARPAKDDQLPADMVLESVFDAAVIAFGHSQSDDTTAPEVALNPAQGRQASLALETLGTMDAARLAAAAAAPETASPEDAAAVALAREMALLPRGIEMLSMAASLPGRESAPLDKATKARCDNALRVLFAADAALAGAATTAQPLLRQARAAAAQVVQSPGFQLEGVEPALRRAFNTVRNDFLESGAGTALHKADDFLKSLTTDMLSSTSRENSLSGMIARTLPIGGATALNPSAIASATKTLAQAGLITDTGLAVDAMKDAVVGLRGGEEATLPERALKALAMSLSSAVPPGTPEQLTRAIAAQVQVPQHFGLDAQALALDPALQQLWAQYENGDLKPAEAAHQLARHAANAPGAAPAVLTFRKALDVAVGSALWNRGKIGDKQELQEGLVSIARLMSLRDKFKFTGGNSYGLDTSKVQLGFQPDGMAAPASLVLRLGLAGKYQHDLVLEIGMTTQAYYLTVGTQSTVGAKVGGGAGVSLKAGEGIASGGARMVDVTASGSYEYQWQEGLLARVPRDKATEGRNQQEFEDLLRNLVMWQERGHNGPADAILSNVDAASLNLLGQYDRESRRGEVAGNLGPQVAVSRPLPAGQGGPGAANAARGGGGVPASAPGPSAAGASGPAPSAGSSADYAQVAQARLSLLQLRSQGELRTTKAEEVSGHYRYQEVKLGARTLTQVGAAASLSLRLKDLGQGKTLNAGDTAGFSRAADWVGGTEVTKRLVTMDGVTDPLRSRRVSEFLDLPRYEQAAKADRARWINHGNTYTKFSADFKQDPSNLGLRQESSEADFEQFFQEAALHDTQFKQYLVVDCLQTTAAAVVDGYGAKIALATKLGKTGEAEALHAEREVFLSDDSTWQPRRLAINSVFNAVNQPGASLLGLEMRVSDNSEGAHNDALFPRG
ncbi:hypothetical protein [Acidovorax sp. SUPP2825]|uniref:hypothetical protein n=1 Tax=Acidovorax sp. SUPP2825 TaxID=2920879 RepID=UPI0023DE416E|nr:hypothetical protein [Acidovorax sp. SUPP2825]GKS95453.1 hypothetical protein AVAK2825_12980 [Acidovorax sp. SUPP2825]